MPTHELTGLGPQGSTRDIRASSRGALHVKAVFWRYVGDEQVTVSTTSVGLTRLGGATRAYIQIRTAPVFWTYAPSRIPSSTVGSDASINDDIYLYGANQIDGFRALRNGSTDSVLKVQYYVETDYDE